MILLSIILLNIGSKRSLFCKLHQKKYLATGVLSEGLRQTKKNSDKINSMVSQTIVREEICLTEQIIFEYLHQHSSTSKLTTYNHFFKVRSPKFFLEANFICQKLYPKENTRTKVKKILCSGKIGTFWCTKPKQNEKRQCVSSPKNPSEVVGIFKLFVTLLFF